MRLLLSILLLATVAQAEELPNGNHIADTGNMVCSCERLSYLDEWIYKLIITLEDQKVPQKTIRRILLQILEGRYQGNRVCR